MSTVKAVVSDKAHRKVRRFFDRISDADIIKYVDYWSSLKAKTDLDYYRRGIFAYLSVHRSWQINVKAYAAFLRLNTVINEDTLLPFLKKERTGCYVNLFTGLLDFHTEYWKNPQTFRRERFRSNKECREFLTNDLFGIGRAKTSFLLELAEPLTCDVVCLDVHVLRLYQLFNVKGKVKTPSKGEYFQIENHWIEECKRRNVPSPIARHIFWDKKQRRRNCRYWSHVFEG